MSRIIPPPPGYPPPEGGVKAALAGWERLMAEALKEARRALCRGEVPVGALVVDAGGSIIGRGHNCPLSKHDPTAHAEIAALRQAARKLKNYRLSGCFLVATLEPCLMCAGAATQARVAGVIYGAADDKAGAVQSRLEALDLDFGNHHPWHMGGILEDECAALLREFFAERRP